MSEALATAMQQGENIQSTTAAPKPEGSLTLDPLSRPAHPTGPPPPLIPLLPDILFVGTPPVGHSFPGFTASPTLKKWDCFFSSSLCNHHDKRTCISSPEVEVRSRHSSARGNKNMPKLVPEAGSSSEH